MLYLQISLPKNCTCNLWLVELLWTLCLFNVFLQVTEELLWELFVQAGPVGRFQFFNSYNHYSMILILWEMLIFITVYAISLACLDHSLFVYSTGHSIVVNVVLFVIFLSYFRLSSISFLLVCLSSIFLETK